LSLCVNLREQSNSFWQRSVRLDLLPQLTYYKAQPTEVNEATRSQVMKTREGHVALNKLRQYALGTTVLSLMEKLHSIINDTLKLFWLKVCDVHYEILAIENYSAVGHKA
jgi:hypothetical protein